MTIRLPLPHRALHPNVRTHWAAKARQAKIHREAARRETFKVLKELDNGHVVTGYILRPAFKDLRVRDDDGFSSSCKAYRDGIADAFRQDDGTFKCLGYEPTVDRKDPHLMIEIITEDLS